MAKCTIRGKEYEVKDDCPIQVSNKLTQMGLKFKKDKEGEEHTEDDLKIGHDTMMYFLGKQVISPKVTDANFEEFDSGAARILFEKLMEFYCLTEESIEKEKKKVTIS